MTRLLGAILLMAGATAVGLAFSSRLNARACALRSLTEALEWMERELSFRLTPTPELFELLARRSKPPAAEFFCRCRMGLDKLGETTLSRVWWEATETLKMLTEEDRETVSQLGLVLGRYDGPEQRLALTQTVEQLKACACQAKAERDRLGRVYATLGLVSGAFLVILLL